MSPSNPWVVPMVLTGLALVAAAVRASRSRSFVQEHMQVAVCCALYTIPYAAELASTSLYGKLLWHRVAWLGIATTPAAAMLLAFRFVGKPARPTIARLVWGIAFAFVVLSSTNELHFWLEGPASLTSYGTFSMRNQAAGPGFWLFALLGYTAVLGSMVCYAAVWLTGSTVYQRQGRLLFFGTSIPLLGNVLYLFLGGTRIRELDPTAILFGVTCLVYAHSLRSGLLQIVPVARHAMFDEMVDAVLVLDRYGRVIDANPAALALVDRHERSHDPTTPLRDFLQNAPALHELLVSDSLGELADAPVGERTFTVRTTSLSSGDGRLVMLRDTTARAEQDQAQRAALAATARANRVRGDFIARMSHELRTPLLGVVGSTDMLLLTMPTSDERRRYAEASMLSARVLLELVDDVLDFERLDRHTLAIVPTSFDIIALWHEVVAAQVHAAERKSLRLACLGAPAVATCWVQGDRRRLRQILTNLVGNSIKFTPSGTIHLQGTIDSEGDRAHIRITIDDEGPGVPEADLERVFEPFVQLDEGTTRHHGGAGLGLAICRQLAAAIGAVVELHNRAEGGLRATLDCTLERAEPTREPAVSAAVSSLRNARVFVVDDHPVSREVIGWLLDATGAQYRLFGTGPALVEAVLQECPDLALVDLHMPGGGGHWVTTTLRGAGVVDLPIIAFTADGRETVRADCLAAGMNDLLQKPCTVAELQACLQRHLQHNAPGRQPGAPSGRRNDGRALFLSTVSDEATLLTTAFAQGDHTEVRRLAHGMAGAAALTGFQPIVDSCRHLLEADPFEEPHVLAVRAACVAATEGA